MSETPSEATPAQEQPAAEPEKPAEPTSPEDTDWKAEARKWEQRAKENSAKAREFEKAQKASMSEAERAVAEAEERGRTAATTEFGKELAASQFDALAGRRNADFDTTQALEYLDLGKLLGEDGRPDNKAISAAVERLVPAAAEKPAEPTVPGLDLGKRSASTPTDDSPRGLITAGLQQSTPKQH